MKVTILITFLTASTIGAWAQGNNSPYSQLGLGDIEDGFYNRTSGMANTGIAYRNNRFLINNNPASFSALPDQYFSVETGLRGSIVNYYGTPVDPSSTQSGDITFRRLAMAMKMTHSWGSSIGLVPFATQNYEFNVPYYIQGSTSQIANHYYQGHGSINKVYWANSYEFFSDTRYKTHRNHISVGVDAGYLFGQLDQKDIIQSYSTGATLTSTSNTVDLRNLYLTYGLQVYGDITKSKSWQYGIGATFSNQQNLLAESNRLIRGSDSSVLQSEEVSQNNLTLPNTFGVGLSLTHKQKYTWLADYKYQGWSDVKNSYTGKNYELVNSQRGSIGFEISKKKVISSYNYKALAEFSYFQFGAFYGLSYLAVNGEQIKDKGISAAIGVNSLRNPLAYSIGLQYGIKGTQAANLVEQRYFNITFMINYGAVWNTHGRKID